MNEIEKKLCEEEFLKARNELGDDIFNQHYREVFGIPCLDFVDSIVINLPEPCYASCDYCIDSYLRKNTIDNCTFLEICEKVLQEFPNIKNVAITGGSLNATDFNYLLCLIKTYLPNSYINWNTNGIGISEEYKPGISLINHINLHRNSVDENINKRVFKTARPVMTIDEAKKLFQDKLCLRITIDENFDFEEYIKLQIPLYLNRLLPGTRETDKIFKSAIQKLNISNEIDKRRRNVYLTANCNNVPVRVCIGDKLSTHIPNRRPTYLNVAIIHRSGIVCGSWYEDDKVIYNPHQQIKNNEEKQQYTLKKSK